MRFSQSQPVSPPGADTRLDPIHLEQIYADYLDPVYSFLYARVGNREDAEDLTSQVFLKAFRKLDVAREDLSIVSWFFTVARTVLADHWRQVYRSAPVVALNENLAGQMNTPSVSDDDGKVQRVNEVLALLPARSRTVLELRFLRGYTIEETARELNITPANVKVIQHRALAKAAALMEAGASSGFQTAPGTQAIA